MRSALRFLDRNLLGGNFHLPPVLKCERDWCPDKSTPVLPGDDEIQKRCRVVVEREIELQHKLDAEQLAELKAGLQKNMLAAFNTRVAKRLQEKKDRMRAEREERVKAAEAAKEAERKKREMETEWKMLQEAAAGANDLDLDNVF